MCKGPIEADWFIVVVAGKFMALYNELIRSPAFALNLYIIKHIKATQPGSCLF